jgi:hypothetical protein
VPHPLLEKRDILSHNAAMQTTAVAARFLCVLPFNPMSLDDLGREIDAFLVSARDEQKNRSKFEKAWNAQRLPGGRLHGLLEGAAGLFSGHAEFSDSKVECFNLNVRLSISFKSSEGPIIYTLTFEPDKKRTSILCESTAAVMSDLGLENLDELAESTVRTFIEAVIYRLSTGGAE